MQKYECVICYETKAICLKVCTQCTCTVCLDCLASIIQTDNIKCPLCRGLCDESVIEETCLFADRVERHYHETVSDTIRKSVTQCINVLRRAISSDLVGSDRENSRPFHDYLSELSSKLSWIRVMTSAHCNFANRFFSIASAASTSHPLYNMPPEEMLRTMFPSGPGVEVHPRRLFREGDEVDIETTPLPPPAPLTTVLHELQVNNAALEQRLASVQETLTEEQNLMRVIRVETSEGWDPEVEAWEDVMLRGPTGPLVNDDTPGHN